jgi:hypothetical protein
MAFLPGGRRVVADIIAAITSERYGWNQVGRALQSHRNPTHEESKTQAVLVEFNMSQGIPIPMEQI